MDAKIQVTRTRSSGCLNLLDVDELLVRNFDLGTRDHHCTANRVPFSRVVVPSHEVNSLPSVFPYDFRRNMDVC